MNNNSCNNNCNTCTSSCNTKCPICNKVGKSVPLITLKSLISKNQELITDSNSYICVNRKCDVIYFQEGNPKYFTKSEIKTQIWFKSALKSQIICYCHNILLTDILEIVNNSNDLNLTKEKIFNILNIKETNGCVYHNPIGESCDKLFKNAIEFAYKQKENNNSN